MAGNYIDKWNANGQEYDIQDAGRGLPLGVATLDNNGRIPYAQLPESAVEFKGYWNASTNTPHLADGSGTKGDMYYVDVAGSQDLGSGTQYFNVGDRVLYDGSIWKNINSTAVKSVNGVLPDAQGNVDIISKVYPVGSIYQNISDSTDPAVLFGVGTWEPITDKFLAARGSTNIGASGGAWGTVLTEENIPQHNHGGSTGGSNANVSVKANYTGITAEHDHNHGTRVYKGGEENHDTMGMIISGETTYWCEWHYPTYGMTNKWVTVHDPSHGHDVSQTVHSHSIGNYGSANPTAVAITPTYVGVYTWKRTA